MATDPAEQRRSVLAGTVRGNRGGHQEARPAASPGLARVAARARKHPTERMQSLAHHLDVEALRRSYDRIAPRAAVGVDGVSKESYGQNLEENLQELHERLRTKRYRHQPIRRVRIPKDKGKTRPIGISTIEDKIVQGALQEILETIYEQDFEDFSYGFRPGRGCRDALRSVDWAIARDGLPNPTPLPTPTPLPNPTPLPTPTPLPNPTPLPLPLLTRSPSRHRAGRGQRRR